MTDNLKTRIAEAIGGNTIMHKEQCNEGIYNISVNIDIEKAAQAVLDIVEPMLKGLQGVIDSQQQTNQALIKKLRARKGIEM